jgi:hypothetical protein
VDVTNNMIVNNVTAVAGALSLVDAVNVSIVHNTIAHNDSVATGGEVVDPGLQVTTPQPSGIVSRAHTAELAGPMQILGKPAFSDPQLVNNIIWQNRSFYYSMAANGGLGGLLPDPLTPVYDDLGVLGAVGDFTPVNCILTGVNADPSFVQSYFNGADSVVITGDRQFATAAALDEGGNFIDVRYGPIQPFGNYHINSPSPAIEAGADVNALGIPELAADFDGQARDLNSPDIGADEVPGGVPAGAPAGPAGVQGVSVDNVTIKRVTYDAVAKTLTVIAASSLQPDVKLSAAGFGRLYWRAGSDRYRRTFTGVAAKPASVTVQSDRGGSATLTVP